MRILYKLLTCFCILLWGCAGQTSDKREWKDVSLKAVITSDLHLSVDPNTVASVVPAMHDGREVTETIAAQVIAEDPDVFILTGDNTNSGNAEDMRVLKEILQKIKDAGIMIVMTSGNHDYNQCSPEGFWDYFSSLLDVQDKDEHSQSYMTEIGNVRIFAMDDNSYDEGRTGTFNKQTMAWLKEGLKTAKEEGKTVLFASHHNVLAGPDGDKGDSYKITNKDLIPLLKQYDVPLCLSGHQHGQVIQCDGDLYEVVSSMPLNGAHQIGVLTIEGRSAEYHTEPIRFEEYGSAELAAKIADADVLEAENMRDIFTDLLKQEGLEGSDYEGVMTLIVRFFACWAEGTLSTEAESILNDPYYSAMTDALRDHNYGPWMEEVLRHPPMDGNHLTIEW